MKKVSILLFIFFVLINFAWSQSLSKAWTSKSIFSTPESVFYDSDRNQIYVSNINGQPTDKDGNGYISLLSDEGTIKKQKWVEGLNAPKGMAVFGGNLFVTDIDRIAIIDIKKGKISKLIDVPGAQFLNDMVADQTGRIYFSDMTTNKILIYENGNITVWLEEAILVSPNGMAFEDGKVLIGCKNYLLSVDPETKNINILVSETGGIDGLIPLGDGYYVISDWSGKIQFISTSKSPVTLQNTSGQKIQAADLGYIPDQKLILIPTFFDNRVIAKKLNQ